VIDVNQSGLIRCVVARTFDTLGTLPVNWQCGGSIHPSPVV
jgi:hypothetical protein